MAERIVAPVQQGTENPLVTFVLFTYNQDHYVEEAVKAALAQTYPNLEIIISDDHSTDSTFETILKTVSQYAGAHAPIIRQNPTNLGLAAHINTVMEIVKGELIVVAAGDDISFPHRVSTLVNHWVSNGKGSGSIFSRFQTIDGEGRIVHHKDPGAVIRFSLAERDMQHTQGLIVGTSGCTQAWTRDIFEIFGPLHPRIQHEDITIPLRSLLLGTVTYLPDELVLYRITIGTLSRASFSDYRTRFKKMARYWEGRVANYEQFECDAVSIALRGGIPPPDLDWLSQFVKAQFDVAALNYRFFSGGFWDQLRAIFDVSISAGLFRRLKLLAIAIFPPMYGIKYIPLTWLNEKSRRLLKRNALKLKSQHKSSNNYNQLNNSINHIKNQ